jgi:hypothetical protein
MIVLAIRALIAGKTVWTPTSQGNNKFFHQILYSTINIYKYDHCHTFMTRVMTGISPLRRSFSPNLSLPPVKAPSNKGNIR